jgi:hypothetical protein
MANSLVALQTQAPDVMGAYNQGAQAAQGRQLNSLRIQGAQQELQNAPEDRRRKQAMEMFNLIGSVGLGAMGGKMDGQVDPAKWAEGLDYLDKVIPGLGAGQYKDHPEMAGVAAQASITAAQRIQLAKSDRDYELAVAEFQHKLDSAPSGPKPYSPAGRVQADVNAGILTPEQAAQSTAPKKTPLSVTAQKEVFQADDSVQAGNTVIQQLNTALELSKKSYSGLGADTRGWITSQFGSEAGSNTEELKNLLTSQALENLKAVFGGMPTEGERKILLEIQGSVDKAPQVREEIYKRAISMAERRIEYNKTKAEKLRSGEYFGEGGSAASGQPSPAAAQGEQTVIDGVTYEKDENGDWFEVQ